MAPSEIEMLLGELEARWQALGAPIAERLRPGLSDDAIDAYTEPVGLRLPVEARAWWGRHDGTEPGAGEGRVIGANGLEWSTLEEAIKGYRTMRRVAEKSATSPFGGAPSDPTAMDYYWEPGWFPLGANGSGGVLACDCSVPDGAPTPIRFVDYHGNFEGFRDPIAGSFTEVVRWWVTAVDDGSWTYSASAGVWEGAPLTAPKRGVL